MLSLRKSAEEDVDSLIDSMLRLIEYMNSNPTFKQDIFKSFSQEDLNKILKNMEDTNEKLRKVSCLFLCSILTNSINCEKFCSMLNLLPVQGKLSITSIPLKLAKIFSQNAGILHQVNNTPSILLGNESPFCWYYQDCETPQVRWFYQSQIRNLKAFFLEFADPGEVLVGVFYQPQRNMTNNYLNSSLYPQTNLQKYSIVRTEGQSLSPQVDIQNRKSVESYRPFTTAQSPTSPIQRQSPSPQQGNRENFGKVKPGTSNQKNTKQNKKIKPIVNAQRMRLENNRNSEKDKPTDKAKIQIQSFNSKQVNKADFDTLRNLLSDNAQQNSNAKSSIQQKQNTLSSHSQNYGSKLRASTNSSFHNNMSPQIQNSIYYKKQQNNNSTTPTETRTLNQDWKNVVISNANYGINNPSQVIQQDQKFWNTKKNTVKLK